MLRLDTFIVAEFVSMLNFFYKKMPGSRLATPTFIIEPVFYGSMSSVDVEFFAGMIYRPFDRQTKNTGSGAAGRYLTSLGKQLIIFENRGSRGSF